jgi:hypothetical protein
MRAEAHQLEAVVIRFAVDEDEIGPDMAVPMIAPSRRGAARETNSPFSLWFVRAAVVDV